MYPRRNPQNRTKPEIRIIDAVSIDMNEAPSKSSDDPTNNANVDNQDHVNILEIIKEFFANSTIHGFRYFVDPKRHWVERAWWVIVVIVSVSMCTVALVNIWRNWKEHPVTVTFDDKTTSVADIPFPAITICSTQKFVNGKVDMKTVKKLFPGQYYPFDALRNLSILSADESSVMDALIQTCRKSSILDPDKQVVSFIQSIYETLKAIAPNQAKMIPSITWYMPQAPEDFPIFTSEGLCFTLNSINSREMYSDEVATELLTVTSNPNASHWSVEEGYTSNVNDRDVYPYRMSGDLRDSVNMNLRIFLDNSAKFCHDSAPGFLFSFNSPDELSQMKNEIIHIQPGQNVRILLKPKMTKTTRGLRSYTPHERSCYFRDEHQLRFFRSYSQQKCELECVANGTKVECDCTEFWMPRDNKTRVCTLLDQQCLYLVNPAMVENHSLSKCDCLPDCTSIGYDAEISQGQLQYFETISTLEKSLNDSRLIGAESKVQIMFKEEYFISLKRSETATVSDFIASCGGLFGLFMGISVLSVVELFYYFTLGVYRKFKNQMKFPKNAKNWTKCICLPITKKIRQMCPTKFKR